MTVANGTVAVGTTPTLIVPSISGETAKVANQGSATVFLGGPNVTIQTGYPLPAGVADEVPPGTWGIVESGSQNVSYLLGVM